MTLFQDTGGDPRAAAAQLADVLALYGALGDATCGNPPGFAARKAACAVSLATVAELDAATRDALYFAGLLHAVGAIGNPAYRKGERLSERMTRIESWDVPAQGARACAEIAGLPSESADLVRWQHECWDGTGYPDQLRWHGIPLPATLLSLADAFVRAGEPEEALASVSAQAGRAFGPEFGRTFTMWFHLTGGEPEPAQVPLDALQADPAATAALLERIADRIDAHNGVAGRWRRVSRLAEAAAGVLGAEPGAARDLAVAARLYGSGEIAERAEDSESSFDPLARLGIDERAAHAVGAAAFAEGNATLGGAAAVLRARGEWFDGTGKPHGLFQKAIPMTSGILAAAIAYDSLDHKDRIEGATGTQFDPRVVRAIFDVARSLA
ncbi:MAG TPA: HD domain-containing phosphohydrolase [Verrucomicrobiae bacterium]|nr:HD domain-containing phosphohydrolase [Verrucomicrobiae bacterium]